MAAITSFRVGKWLPTAGAFARFLLLGLFTITVIIYAAKHGAHGLGASSYSTSFAGFVLLTGVLLFNFVGFELPNSAGEEMINPRRDVPFGIARSTVLSVLLYALPVIGILVVLPSKRHHQLQRVRQRNPGRVHRLRRPRRGRWRGDAQRGGADPRRLLRDLVHPLPAHVRRDLDHGLGPGAGRVLLRRVRPPAVRGDQRQVGHPGAGERVQRAGGDRRVSCWPTKITSGNAAKYFNAVLGVTISTTLISYLLIYPALWKLRRSHPAHAPAVPDASLPGS